MNDHTCDRPTDPTEDDPYEWTCPVCRMAWEKRIEATDDFYDSWYQPREDDGPCPSCERCTWNKGHDCDKTDHPHCPACSHCLGRHTEQDKVWAAILDELVARRLALESADYPGVTSFEIEAAGPATIRLTVKTAAGETVTQERTLTP